MTIIPQQQIAWSTIRCEVAGAWMGLVLQQQRQVIIAACNLIAACTRVVRGVPSKHVAWW